MENPFVPDSAPLEVAALARSLGCITESDLCRLGKIAPTTAEAWRKRGTGPAFIRFGNAVLYPQDALAAYLRAKLHKPVAGVPVRTLL